MIPKPTNPRFNDLTDKKSKSGLVTFLEYKGTYPGTTNSLWKCRCICGTIFTTVGSALVTGVTNSCGAGVHRVYKTHRMVTAPEWKSWSNMKAGCYNPNHKTYRSMGARGIKIHPSWLDSFEVFLNDMGRRPSRDYKLSRKDKNQDYCPDNCEWIKYRNTIEVSDELELATRSCGNERSDQPGDYGSTVSGG